MANTGYPFYKAWKANGVQPASGYLLYTYVSGSTVPKITYQDAEFNASNTNPIVLNANGEATIFLDDGPYRFDLKTPGGALISSFDPIENPTGGGTVSFAAPTAEIGLIAIPGVATTCMRSDAAPALSQAITPTWTALHTFALAPLVSAFAGVGSRMVVSDATGQLGVQAIPSGASGANPTGTIGLAVVNGSAGTFLRSDGAPALSQAIAPTWSAQHTFTLAPIVSAFAGGGTQMVTANNAGALGVAAIPSTPVGANPSGTIGLTVVNGAAATFLRSDGAPALSQAITPTWSALHTFTLAPKVTAFAGTGDRMVYADSTGQTGVQAIPGTVPGDLILKPTSTAPAGYTYTGTIISTIYNWVLGVVGHPAFTALSNMSYASNGNFMYVISGTTGGAVTSAVTSKNLITMVSTALTGMTAGRQNAAAACDGTYVYVSGGHSDLAATVATNTLYRYSIAGNSWATMTNIPINIAKHAMVYYSGKLYLFGGVDSTPTLLSTVRIYDIATDTWSTGANLTTARKECAAAVVGAYVYVFGGNDTAATVSLSTVNERYDIVGNSFSTKTALPLAITMHSALSSGNLILSTGGALSNAGTLKAQRQCYIYDHLSDIWYKGAILSLPRYAACIGMVGADICFTSGIDITGSRNSTFEMSTFPTIPYYVMSKN